jgi:hypothetical protein
VINTLKHREALNKTSRICSVEARGQGSGIECETNQKNATASSMGMFQYVLKCFWTATLVLFNT